MRNIVEIADHGRDGNDGQQLVRLHVACGCGLLMLSRRGGA
jgi:hypothetical protein